MSMWRLIPAPYRIMILVAVAVAVCGFFFAAGHRWSSNAWALKYTERENALLKAVADAKDRIREMERETAENLNAVDEAYQKGLTDGKATTERTISDLRAGNLRLRRDLAASACADSDSSPAPGSSDAAAGTELWRAAAEDLVRLADEADAVVRQLGACQAVISEYRRLYSQNGE